MSATLDPQVDPALNTSPQRVYTYQDLIKFSGTEIYSGFGEMRESVRPSAPKYSFGKSKRKDEPKKYISQEMASIDCFGKSTPQGPAYNPTDKFAYNLAPKYKFGTTMRNTLDTAAKFEHYLRKDIDFEPDNADVMRRTAAPRTRIGTEPRFPGQPRAYKLTPGPQYDPTLRLEIPKAPQYSLGSRRAVKGFDPLMQLNSTTPIVGPGSYYPEKCADPSQRVKKPAWSISKGPRSNSAYGKFAINETYEEYSAIGDQTRSQKPSMPQYRTGRSKRDNPSGIFKEHMSFRPQSVRIQHPRI